MVSIFKVFISQIFDYFNLVIDENFKNKIKPMLKKHCRYL
jgi:hypothetical protein